MRDLYVVPEHAVVADLEGADAGPLTLGGLAKIVESLEEPIGDSAIVPLWHLCKATRESVTVALSGEGGDEALGGYGRYYWGAVAEQLHDRPTAGFGIIRGLSGALPGRTSGFLNFVRRARKLADTIALPEAARYLSWFDLFTLEERLALSPASSSAIDARVEALFAKAHALGLDPVQRLQYVDIHTFLLDNLLLKSDKLSMAHSLEVRVPLLDRSILELGLSLPPWAKVSRTRSKRLLRKILRRDDPAARMHLRDDCIRYRSLIKGHGAAEGDALEGARQDLLPERIPRLERRPVASHELRERGKTLPVRLKIIERGGKTPAYGESVPCEMNRRRDEITPGQGSIEPVCLMETSNGARNSRRHGPENTLVLDHVPERIEIHIPRGGAGRFLPEVDECGLARSEMSEQETAPADITGLRIGYREGKPDGHRRIDGIAAPFQNLHPNGGCRGTRRDDDPAPPANLTPPRTSRRA